MRICLGSAEAIPSPEHRLHLFELAKELLTDAGYVALGIDHFALLSDGLARSAAARQMHRNFQGYTDDQAPVLIGFGASSISRVPQVLPPSWHKQRNPLQG